MEIQKQNCAGLHAIDKNLHWIDHLDRYPKRYKSTNFSNEKLISHTTSIEVQWILFDNNLFRCTRYSLLWVWICVLVFISFSLFIPLCSAHSMLLLLVCFHFFSTFSSFSSEFLCWSICLRIEDKTVYNWLCRVWLLFCVLHDTFFSPFHNNLSFISFFVVVIAVVLYRRVCILFLLIMDSSVRWESFGIFCF